MTDRAEELQREAEAMIGSTISDRYRIDSLIGVGGMGVVFRARHLGLDRDVAMKILHRELMRDPQVSPRFDREARSASRLDHPNCLRVMDYGSTADGMKFMVMQLLEGVELSTLLGAPLPPARATQLILQIVRGLEHAHGQAVVHRDLKPENVFVTSDHEERETLKLFDFGISKIISDDESEEKMTRLGLVFGTPQYMSPEQATGMDDIDARTDLYSTGIILYEMLTGNPPFSSDDPVAVIRMQVSTDPPPLPATVPPELASIVTKLVAKRREERFSSATLVREALEGFAVTSPGWQEDARIPVISPVPVMARTAARARLRQTWVEVRSWLEGRPWLTTRWWAKARSWLESRPWLESRRNRRIAVAGGGAALALLLVCAVWPTGDPEEQSGPPATVGAVDLAARGSSEGQSPWNEGRRLAKEGEKEQALARYADAIDRDRGLLDDDVFYGELLALLRVPELGPQALDVAIDKMGRRGHEFLLELVNREEKVLRFNHRHRALDGLATSPESQARVDVKVNTALDLLQAEQSPTPCITYRSALERIQADPDPYYRSALARAKVPHAGPNADFREQAACEGLERERKETLARLGSEPRVAKREGGARSRDRESSDEASGGQASAGSSEGKGKSPSSRPSGECSKPFAIFKKKCRK